LGNSVMMRTTARIGPFSDSRISGGTTSMRIV
jgi:hypothetical protein